MKIGPTDPQALRKALDESPSLLFEVARSANLDDLIRCLDAMPSSDDRRMSLVLSALGSRTPSAEELVRIAGALDVIEQLKVWNECRTIPRAQLEAAGFAADRGSWWGRVVDATPELGAVGPASVPVPEPGRTGEERREFAARFPLGDLVQQARLGFVAERKSNALGPASEPLPPGLAAFLEANDFGPRIDAIRSGRAGLAAEEREQIATQLATLDDGARFQLRELLLPKRPLHPLRAAHARTDALQGKATVAKLMAILSGELFGARQAPSDAWRARVDQVLRLVGAHLPHGTELEWAEVLSRSSAATTFVDRYGAGALHLLSAFRAEDLEGQVPAPNYVPLIRAAPLREGVAAEAKAYLDQRGPRAFAEALEILDSSGRAEQPELGDGWAWKALDPAEVVIPSSTALELLPFATAVELFDFLSKNQAAVRAALFLIDPGLSRATGSFTVSEDARARAVVRLVREQGVDGLRRMAAHAKERIHEFGDGDAPLWTGAAWPPLEVTKSARAGASVEELSSETRRMLDDLSLAGARESVDRELLGRRFVAFTYYDPLYQAGVANPEHRYSTVTFDAWKNAEAETRKRAEASRGKPLESGWLASLFSDLHAMAGAGILDARQSGNMSHEQLGRLRSSELEQVGLPELVEIDRATANRLKANRWLGRRTEIMDSGSPLQARIYFADGHRVPGMIAELDQFVRTNEGRMPIEKLIAEVHNALVGIHAPFDGNGRTSKLVVDFLLDRAGVEPMIWRQRHPLKDPTTAETVRTGVQFTHDTVRRHWVQLQRSA